MFIFCIVKGKDRPYQILLLSDFDDHPLYSLLLCQLWFAICTAPWGPLARIIRIEMPVVQCDGHGYFACCMLWGFNHFWKLVEGLMGRFGCSFSCLNWQKLLHYLKFRKHFPAFFGPFSHGHNTGNYISI